MSSNRNNQVAIRQYLLGQLTGDELDRFEEQLFVDEELVEELLAAEDELIDESIAGELSSTEAVQFDEFFLVTREREDNLRYRKALKRVLKKKSTPIPFPVSPKASRMYWPTAAIAAILVVAFLGGPALLGFLFPPQPRTFTVLALTAVSNDRAPGAPVSTVQKIKVPLRYDDLKLQLTLPDGSTPVKDYRVEMQSGDGTKKTLEKAVQNGQAVEVVIPAADLKVGEYAFNVILIKPDGTEERVKGSYLLAAEPPS
jgi:hypothetical protein